MEKGVRTIIAKFLGVPVPKPERKPWKKEKPGDVNVRVLNSGMDWVELYTTRLSEAFKKAKLGRIVYRYGPLPETERPDFGIVFYPIKVHGGHFEQRGIWQSIRRLGAVPDVYLVLVFVIAGWTGEYTSLPELSIASDAYLTNMCGVHLHVYAPGRIPTHDEKFTRLWIDQIVHRLRRLTVPYKPV